MSKTTINYLTLIKRFVFGTIGLLIIIGAVIGGIRQEQFVSRAEVATGKVVKLNAGGSHPEVKFTTAAGDEIEYPQGGLIGGYQVGDQVNVYYESQTPRNCSIDSFGALWGFLLLALLGGIVFVCVGLFLKSET